MSKELERADALFEQERWEMALEEYLKYLAEYAEDSHALCMAARCYLQMEVYGKASEYAALAISADPTHGYAFYIQSYIFFARNLYEESKRAIQEALELEPLNPDFHVQVARLKSNASDWLGVLDAADAALQEVPHHADAQIMKASALVRLRKADQAAIVLEAVLENDPENDYALTELGFLYLHEGQWEPAMETFQQALHIDPESEGARAGFMEAMRAKFPVYGLVLRYFLLIGRYSKKHQMAIAYGTSLAMKALEYLRKQYPVLAPLIGLIISLWRIFSYLTWTIQSATTLLLRCNKFGRSLVRQDEIVESNIVGGLWLAALFCFLYHTFVDPFTVVCRIGIPIFLTLPMVVGGSFGCKFGWPMYVARAVLLVMSVCSLLGLVLWTWSSPLGLKMLLFYFNSLGWVLLGLSYLEQMEPVKH
jgi:tetratricopeptide (TPR) repeat protein